MGVGNSVVPEGIDREQRVALSVRQVPDGDEGDVRLRHRQGLDATSQPRHGVEAGEVKAQTNSQPFLGVGVVAQVL